jgi:Fe2+ or Zn2+ uptake regulation protein
MSIKGSKWDKYGDVQDQILEVLTDVKGFITTNNVKENLEKDFNVKVSNPTLTRYLQELKEQGQITGFESAKANVIRMWGIANGPAAQ